MRIGVYTGSFDPVHIGHKQIVDYLLEHNYLDKVIIMPTGNYWNKQNITNIRHRINMLKYYENNKIIINNKYNNLPYTYQILEKLKEDYPGSTFYLILGADNLIKFHLWKEVEQILENKVLVLPRDNIESSIYINKFRQKENFTVIKNFKQTNVSSSLIRDIVKKEKYIELDKYLDKDIIEYIVKNDLYK